MSQHNSVAITEVQAAQERILGIAHRTPVLKLSYIDQFQMVLNKTST